MAKKQLVSLRGTIIDASHVVIRKPSSIFQILIYLTNFYFMFSYLQKLDEFIHKKYTVIQPQQKVTSLIRWKESEKL